MPPKPNVPKRKRGRPSNASRAQDAPQPDHHDANEGDEEDEIATAESPENAQQSKKINRKRRGGIPDEPEQSPVGKRKRRPRAADGEQPEAAEGSPDAEQAVGKRKRRRISREQGAEDGNEDELRSSPVPTRRRGRPSAEEAPVEESHDPAPAPTQRKRGRPRAAQEPDTQPADEAAEEPKRRGRPRKSDGADAADTERPKARGRPRKPDASGTNEEAAAETDAEPARHKRRGRPRRSDASEANEDVAAEASEEPVVPRKRGRPRRSDGSEVNEGEVADANAGLTEPKKRGRPRRSDVSEADGQPAAPVKKGKSRQSDASDGAERTEPAKRGRHRRSDISETATEAPGPKKRGRPRRSDISEEGASQVRPSTTAANRRSPSPDALSPDQPQKRPYAYLAPKQREIPVSTISASWTPLQAPSLALTRQILQLSTRPVLQTLAPGPRRDAASSALRAATKRLSSKLSKGLPFPPASRAAASAARRSRVPRTDGREAELDFEGVASEMESLEGRLQPLLHSIDILRAEEERMVKVLERETAELEGLARNGREERKVWREGLRRKAHPLVPERWDPDGDTGDRLALTPKEDVPSEWIFTNAKGSLPLSTLTSHITSLRNNVRPLGDLDRAMVDSEAAIRRVLARALEPERYEAAVMAERV